MRKIIFILCFYFSISAIVWAEDVAIVIGSDISTFNTAADGIKDVLSKGGYTKIDFYDASKDSNFLAKIQAKKYMAICALGTSPFRKVKDSIKDTPIVFSMVLDPVESGVISTLDPSGDNFTGVSLDVSADVQLELIHRILSSCKTVGIIYSDKSNRLLSDAKKVQNVYGVTIEAIKVASSTEVPNALRTLPNVDLLWILPDVRVCTKDSMPFILNYATEKKLPVFAFAEYLVKAGALLGYTYDYFDVGRQTGEVLVKIFNGTSAGSIPVSGPRKVGYAINTKTIKFLGISLPSSAVADAEQKFE